MNRETRGKREDWLRVSVLRNSVPVPLFSDRPGRSAGLFQDPRRGFTLIETMFVMAVASVVIYVLLTMLFHTQKIVAKGENTLDFLRKSTILMDKVRLDIRGADRRDSISPPEGGTNVTITKEVPSGKDDDSSLKQTVSYAWDDKSRTVSRVVKGGKGEGTEVFGSFGVGMGFITKFQISLRNPTIKVKGGKDVAIPGFYEVELEMASEEEARNLKPGESVKGAHRFRALVSKRAPEVKDDLWKSNP